MLRVAGVAGNEQSHRLYHCGRCHAAVQICRHCDHGNLYCAGECAAVRRRESLRRAGQRYQRSRRGACLHAARQSTWRARHRQKVTHQGSLPAAVTATVAVTSIEVTTPVDHADSADIEAQPSRYPSSIPRRLCSFCRRVLAPFARLGPLRGGP